MTAAAESKRENVKETADGHHHLKVVAPVPGVRRRWAARWSVIVLALAAVGLQVSSLSQPWWWIKLYAPQYPKGLQIIVSLTGVSGDAKEVDILNHYIGMASLTQAAPTERQLAGYGIAVLAVAVVALTLIAGKKLGRLLAAVGFVFPFAFIADSYYWMYRFGHSLNPEAPIRLPSFTPQLFGNGKIGQFMTFAQPTTGFWMAVAAFVLLAGAAVLRARVCNSCAKAGNCGAVCRDAFVGPQAGASP
ncbi:MAG: cytochrome C [Myxococcales bacterium]|nr:cytochrome C [Myxococcales bacterium]